MLQMSRFLKNVHRLFRPPEKESVYETEWRLKGRSAIHFFDSNQGNIFCRPRYALVYIGCLVENNHWETAARTLEEYKKKWDFRHVEDYLLVSLLAQKLGVAGRFSEIDKSAYIFRMLQANRENRLFESLVGCNSVALVGNAPSEIGRNHGFVIDDHDIVTRFNNYQIKGFEADYGRKTDFWVRAGGEDVSDREISDFRLCLLCFDVLHRPVSSRLRAFLHDNLRNGKPVDYIDFSVREFLRVKGFQHHPTAGLATAAALYQLRGKLTPDSLFGFSFRQVTHGNEGAHYFNDRSQKKSASISKAHEMQQESILFQKMIAEVQHKNI